MLATAAFAVLLGLFVPCTSHATEIKDTDQTTVQWDKATVEEKTDADNDKYLLYTLPNTNYDSYDDAITGLAKYMVDATADRKYNSVSVLFPFTVVTDKTIDEAVDMSVDIDDKIDSWIRFGDNMTKREILSFSGSDWKKHENLSSFNTNIINWKKTDNGYSGLAVCAVEYSHRYDFTEYETKCLNAIKEMNVDGKSDYDKALALCKWVKRHIKYKSSEVFLGDQSGMQGMMEGWGVCNAYATLTCYLGRCLGLDILYEGGDTWNDSHAWNLVKIGDEWYYTDPTNMILDGDTQFIAAATQFVQHWVDNRIEQTHRETSDKGTQKIDTKTLCSTRKGLNSDTHKANSDSDQSGFFVAQFLQHVTSRITHDGIGDKVCKYSQRSHPVRNLELIFQDIAHR